MLDIAFGPAAHRCDGVSRRDALRAGGVAGVSLAALLQADAARAAAPTTRAPAAKSVVLVYLGGGLSHHDSFDPKPDAAEEIRGKYKTIATRVPGLALSEKLPKLAGVMDKVALIRSAAHGNDHHETATNWVMSGRFGSPFGDYPAVGAVVSHQLGFRGTLPPYVAVPHNPGFTWELGKSAFLGGRYESFKAGDPNQKDYKVENVTPALPPGDRRETLLAAVDSLAKRVEGNDQLATYGEFQRRAAALVLSSEARKAFDLSQEPDKLRDRYGRTTFGQSALLARRLVEAGVRFVTVNFSGWDHHAKIYDGLDKKLPELDAGLSALVADMHARGTAKDTLVVVMGEFGRGPKINKDAGRDHWGPAGSLVMFGAGVKQGFVLGKTDKHGGHVTQRPVAPADVAYTILDAAGIDPHAHLTAPDGRPIAILDAGEPVRELFA